MLDADVIKQLKNLQIVDAVSKLKSKVIDDYDKFVRRLNKGYREEYYIIMNEINLIEMYSQIDNSELYLDYYLNYGL